MKMFLWHRLEYMTHNYHPEAGVVVIADNQQDAKIKILEGAPQAPNRVPIKDADFVCEVAMDTPESIFIFPDAGCC